VPTWREVVALSVTCDMKTPSVTGAMYRRTDFSV
jgi:hypothetical protein